MGAGARAGLSAALQSLHLVSVILHDGVAMAQIVRGDIGLVDLRGVVVLMCLGFGKGYSRAKAPRASRR